MNNDQPSNSETEADERSDETIDDRAREMLTLIGNVSTADEDRLDIIEGVKLSSDDFWKLADIIEYGTAAALREFADELGVRDGD